MHWIYEVIGYVGSAFVLVSFLMSSVLKLRILNTVGSIVSLAYGLAIHAYPTVIMNACLAVINVIQIVKLMRHSDKKVYHMHASTSTDDFLNYFVETHMEDILHFFKGFVFEKDKYNFVQTVNYNYTMISVILGHIDENGLLEVYLDYVTPEYRDCSVGKYVYSHLDGYGVKKIAFMANPAKSIAYLKKIGFNCNEGIPIKTY